MFKIIIIILAVMASVACNPVEKNGAKTLTSYPFTCLATQSHCVVNTEIGLMAIKFSGVTEQGMLKTELPFHISVELTEIDKSHKIQHIESFLEGKDMFMGKVPVFFTAEPSGKQLIAETMLASCSEEVMRWRLWITVETSLANDIKQQSIFVDFDSIRL